MLRQSEIVVDCFAGGGGASTGIERAIGRPVDYAVNHNAKALAVHMANHPRTVHLQENIRNLDPGSVAPGRQIGLGWFSPDCTYYSKARGGKPFRDPRKAMRIRGLATSVIWWMQQRRPRVVMLENVSEFSDWGPLLDTGLPCPIRRGQSFRRWHRRIENLGYRVDMRQLVASEHGAGTTRKRLFVVARCDGEEIVFPERTHGPGLQPYVTAADCIDWSIPCPSIFTRRKPLAEATMRRIARGVMRYVVNNARPFMAPVKPSGFDRRSLAAAFMARHYGGNENDGHPLDIPVSTITTKDHHHLVTLKLEPHASSHRSSPGVDREQSHRSAPGRDDLEAEKHEQHSITRASQDGDTKQGGILDGEALHESSTVRHLVAQACMDDTEGTNPSGDGGESRGWQQAEQPSRQLDSGHTQRELPSRISNRTSAAAERCQADENSSDRAENRGSILLADSIEAWHLSDNRLPSGSSQVAAFIIVYYGTEQDARLRDPLPTCTTKHRFGLVTVEGKPYEIVDIGMRMLEPRELARATSFGDDYILDPLFEGKPLSKTDQVWMIGNAVPPAAAEALVRANFERRQYEAVA